jgi:Zn ribbon nucleic-acid-binding protein
VSDPFRNYDSWLEAPYQRAQAEGLRLECPECNAQMDEDAREQSVEGPECGYANGRDWDAEAERRAEAREIDMDARYGERDL